MIIRDNVSPRGRYEESPPRPVNLPSGFFVPEGGVDWANMDFMFPRRTPERRLASKAKCVQCKRDYMALNITITTTCSATCRKRRQREAQRAKREGATA